MAYMKSNVEIFDRDVKTIDKHINKALKEELDCSTVANFATVRITKRKKCVLKA